MMNSATITGPCFDGGPTVEQLEDESSMWNVPSELVEGYLAAALVVDRRSVREVEGNVKAGLNGSKTITSSWLLGLRAEAREAAGLEPIPLDKIGDYRVTELWPVEVEGLDGVTAWVLHQRCIDAALDGVKSREFKEALNASMGQAMCPVCSVSVTGPSSGLCELCSDVLSFVTMERARALAAVKVGGKTRERLVSDWLARSG